MFDRIRPVVARIQITFDANEPDVLARFWAAALGYVLQPPPDGFASWEDFATEIGVPPDQWGDLAAITDPEENQPRILFARVPEGKTAKNRVHLDVSVTVPSMDLRDRREAIDREVARLIAIGSSKVDDRGDTTHTWTVMLDPEGNEFCIQ